MKKSNFYRLYVDGYRENVLINADDMSDALRVSSMCLDGETVCNVRLVRAHEKSIDLEEVRNCDILTYNKRGCADDE